MRTAAVARMPAISAAVRLQANRDESEPAGTGEAIINGTGSPKKAATTSLPVTWIDNMLWVKLGVGPARERASTIPSSFPAGRRARRLANEIPLACIGSKDFVLPDVALDQPGLLHGAPMKLANSGCGTFDSATRCARVELRMFGVLALGFARPRSAANPSIRARRLDQSALLDGRLDERGEQRVGIERLGLQLRVELDADEPGMVGALDDFREGPVG